jgi:hypothetical protein
MVDRVVAVEEQTGQTVVQEILQAQTLLKETMAATA